MACSVKSFMNVGDTMTFDLSYTPTSSNIKVGVLTPRNTFLNYTASNGTLSKTLSAVDCGVHQMRIQNPSTSSVSVTGTFSFTTPFEYMFKITGSSPKIPSYISDTYRSGHYAIDITTGTAGEIEDYPVYNALSGKVIYNTVFSDGYITCVAVKHDNGWVSRYLHMNLANNGLSTGSTISTGSQVGKVSDKGSEGAYHLHYDINNSGNYYGLTSSNTINPTILFPNISFT